MHCVFSKNRDALQLLLAAGADVNICTDVSPRCFDCLPRQLHYLFGLTSFQSERTALMQASQTDMTFPVVKLLLEAGADVHAVSKVRPTACVLSLSWRS
jgi:ankyrin repeat protein